MAQRFETVEEIEAAAREGAMRKGDKAKALPKEPPVWLRPGYINETGAFDDDAPIMLDGGN